MTDKQEKMEELREALPEHMAEKMEEGWEKYGDAWLDTDPEYLWRRAEEEMLELRQEVEHYRDLEEALKELSDQNNFLIMYMIQELYHEENDD